MYCMYVRTYVLFDEPNNTSNNGNGGWGWAVIVIVMHDDQFFNEIAWANILYI
jgi:hypothetical protein